MFVYNRSVTNTVRFFGGYSMAKKGLTRDIIIDAALVQIEENGLSAFSLRNLAASMKIQVSSLYNHINGQNDLLAEVGIRAVDMLTEFEETATMGKQRDDALYALADAYRQFAKEHTELYRIIMGVHILNIPMLESAAEKIVRPILCVLSEYGIDDDLQIHYQRLLRSIMHGFFEHENSGGFSDLSIDKDTSYHFSIGCVITLLNSNRGENVNESR